MKRFSVVVAAAVVFLFAGSGLALAAPGMMGGPGMMSGQKDLDPDDDRLIAKFREETKDLRREMRVKRARLRALMMAEKPDDEQIGKLAGELFDLQDQLRNKAEKAGVPVSLCGKACGMGGGPGHMGPRGRSKGGPMGGM